MDTISVLAVLVIVSGAANLIHWRCSPGARFLVAPKSSWLRGTLAALLVATVALALGTLVRWLPGVVGGVVGMVFGVTLQAVSICSRHARRAENAAA